MFYWANPSAKTGCSYIKAHRTLSGKNSTICWSPGKVSENRRRFPSSSNPAHSVRHRPKKGRTEKTQLSVLPIWAKTPHWYFINASTRPRPSLADCQLQLPEAPPLNCWEMERGTEGERERESEYVIQFIKFVNQCSCKIPALFLSPAPISMCSNEAMHSLSIQLSIWAVSHWLIFWAHKSLKFSGSYDKSSHYPARLFNSLALPLTPCGTTLWHGWPFLHSVPFRSVWFCSVLLCPALLCMCWRVDAVITRWWIVA